MMLSRPRCLRSFMKFCKCQQYGSRKSYNLSISKESVRSLSSLTSQKYYDDASYFHQVGEQPLMYKTIGDCLQEAANKWPGRIWIKDRAKDETYSFSQALEYADKLAAGFIQLGLKPGDCLAICSPNSARWILACMAAARAGLVSVLINPLYQQRELNYSLEKVKAKCLLIPSASRNQNYYHFLCDISPDLPKQDPYNLQLENLKSLKTLIMLDDKKLGGALTYTEVLKLANTTSVQGISRLQKYITPDSGCNIQFTSGTTGNPKAAYLSHFNNVNNSYLIGKRGNFGEKHNKICAQVPLFHAFGFVVVTQASLQHGTSVVLPSEWYNSDDNLRTILKEKCTILGGTPTMHLDLISNVRKHKVQCDSLDLVITGGASCSPQTIQEIKDEVGARTVKSLYGLTETTGVNFMSLDNEPSDINTQTVGHVHEHIEVKVVDADNNVVPYGTPGEICVRGYCCMLGYWGDPEKTKEMIGADKWLKTGDQMILRKDGYGQVVGRLKDMIIRGGENVFPKEIEDFLHTHPDILECHVFGVNDNRLGEEICAGIMVKEGSQFDQKQLTKYCEGKIASFKIPRHLRILKNFPKTGSGKIQKFKLREMFEKGTL